MAIAGHWAPLHGEVYQLNIKVQLVVAFTIDLNMLLHLRRH
jgi:hypothetical protein